MLSPRQIAVAAVSIALLATTAACGGGDNAPEATPSSSSTPTSHSPSPTEPAPSDTSTPVETPEEQAQRLALAQVEAYYRVGDRLYGDPNEPLGVLDDYARDQALGDKKQSIQERREKGERIDASTRILRSWLGEERVAFNKKAPRAVVDLYVCYDIGNAAVVDASGTRTPLVGPDVPRVAQARFAVYADQWPNKEPGAWRIGREFAAGEPCQR